MIIDAAKSHLLSFPVQGEIGFIALVIGLIICVAVKGLSSMLRSNHLPLPPGPRPFPIIGNMLDFPSGLSEPEGPHLGRHKALFGGLYLSHGVGLS